MIYNRDCIEFMRERERMDWLINHRYSFEGDKVFDPCCGSGSHLLVAKELGRKVCGCELDKEWYKIAKERVESI